MEEYSRPATLEDLKALIRSLNQQGAEYLLIGGYALFAHDYHRYASHGLITVTLAAS